MSAGTPDSGITRLSHLSTASREPALSSPNSDWFVRAMRIVAPDLVSEDFPPRHATGGDLPLPQPSAPRRRRCLLGQVPAVVETAECRHGSHDERTNVYADDDQAKRDNAAAILLP
jgi:hypothetical protein